MSFRSKIFLVLALVGLAPLLVIGWLSFSLNRAELEKQVGGSQAALAQEAARGAERTLARAIESLRLSVAILPVFELEPAERSAALLIPYRQLDFVGAVALVGADGTLLAEPAFGPRKPQGDTAALVTTKDVKRFLDHVPLRLALETGTAMSAPYSASGISRVAVALRIDGEKPVAVAAEVSLSELDHGMAGIAQDGQIAYAATADGMAIAGSRDVLSEDELSLVRATSTAQKPVSRMVTRRDGNEWLASAFSVAGVGWTVVVAQPAEAAFRAAHRVRLYTLYWAAVTAAAIAALGFVLSRGLSNPIRKLSQAAKALTEGRYDTRADVESSDEVGQFATAFNHMALEVKKRDDEIRAWNAELKQRVDERTAELKAAQDQILRTRRLAALGSLGAGVAHELNNPLTAVTGLLALLRKELGASSEHAAQTAIVQQVQEQARKVAKIVSDLRQFADQERAVVGKKFSLTVPVASALELYSQQLEQRQIRVSTDFSDRVPEAQGDPIQIQQVVAHLVQNAIQAMPSGGDLKIALSAVAGDAIKLTVADSGRGIPEEMRERIFDPFFSLKDQAKGVGLGLSISNSIVEAHHGRILVDSAPGKGSIFTVLLPAAAAAAHLC
ncbi:MAG TPA: ATP-binding protein [Myxococcales bacterium]|nr:ATP-binding protein [Myxococcales bacterium]